MSCITSAVGLGVPTIRPCRSTLPSYKASGSVCFQVRHRCFQQILPKHRQPLVLVLAASDDVMLAEMPEPEDARGAITLGLKLSDSGNYEEALEMYVKALDLPGTGIKRFRDKPPGISDGEKQSALYNIACCHSRLGNTREGLAALAGCLEAGYEDLGQLRGDPDLEALRKDERFEGLIKRLVPDNSGFFGGLLKGFK